MKLKNSGIRVDVAWRYHRFLSAQLAGWEVLIMFTFYSWGEGLGTCALFLRTFRTFIYNPPKEKKMAANHFPTITFESNTACQSQGKPTFCNICVCTNDFVCACLAGRF